MALAYINDTLVKFINEPELSDMLSPNGSSFQLVIFNNVTRFIGGRVEIKDDDGNLMASGHVKSESLKIGVRIYTTLEVIDPTWYLEANPFSYNANGTFANTLDFLLLLSGVDYALTAFRYKTSSDILTKQCNFSMQNETLKAGIQKAIDCTGYPLIFHIPLGENVIEIVQQGYGDNAPLPTIDLADLYTNCSLGIYDINTTKIPPLFSRIDVRGRNGDKITSAGSVLPLDQRRFISVGNSQYELFRNADEIIKFLVTQPISGIYCLLLSWVDADIFIGLSGTPTGAGFTVDAANFSASAVGTYTVSIDLPADPVYTLRYFVTYDLGGNVLDYPGQIIFAINGVFHSGLTPTVGFGQSLITADLSSYAGTTVELQFYYNNTGYDSVDGFTGYVNYSPIRVCPGLQLNVPAPSGWYNQVYNPIRPDDIAEDIQTVELVNPDTGQPEFFVYRIAVSSLADSDPGNYCKLYINGDLVFSFDFTAGSPLSQYYFLDESLAGETVEIKLQSYIGAVGQGALINGFLFYA